MRNDSDSSAPDGHSAAYVQSLDRGLSVIRALAQHEPQTLSEVANATHLARATARRFLLTLEQLHYVQQHDRRFSLTPQVLELGYAYLSSLSLPEIAGPHLSRLVEQVRESSSVSILDGNDIVYVARVPVRSIMSVAISLGTRFPAHATSMGRVLLADLSSAERVRLLDGTHLERITPTTIDDRAELDAELDRVCRDGYALVDQELEVGLRSIAVPIRNATGNVVAAVNLSVHASVMTTETMREELLPPLRNTADAISRELGLTSGAT